MDRRLQLTAALAKRLPDPRDPTKVIHPLVTLLRQRIDGLCQGDEDRHDHERLRTDVALPTAVEQDDELASAATLCRWRTVPTGAPRGWCSSGGMFSGGIRSGRLTGGCDRCRRQGGARCSWCSGRGLSGGSNS